eukprot:scaffold82513_cov33-Phaeocystis_antarctica.AAC.3
MRRHRRSEHARRRAINALAACPGQAARAAAAAPPPPRNGRRAQHGLRRLVLDLDLDFFDGRVPIRDRPAAAFCLTRRFAKGEEPAPAEPDWPVGVVDIDDEHTDLSGVSVSVCRCVCVSVCQCVGPPVAGAQPAPESLQSPPLLRRPRGFQEGLGGAAEDGGSRVVRAAAHA